MSQRNHSYPRQNRRILHSLMMNGLSHSGHALGLAIMGLLYQTAAKTKTHADHDAVGPIQANGSDL